MRAIPRLVQGWMPKTSTALFGSIQRSFARRLYKPSALKKEAMEEANLLKQQAFEEMEEDDIENSGLGIEEKRRRLEEKKKAKYRESKASLLDILEKVDEKQCRGCGAHFQFDAPLKEGYIDLRRIKATPISKSQEQLLAKTIRQRKFKEPGDDNEDEGEEEHTIIQEIGDKREGQDTAKMYTVRDYQNDNISLEDVKDLEDLFEGKVIKKDICDRCMMINQGDFEKLKKIEANIDTLVSSKETIGMKKLASSLKELNLPGSKKYIHTIGVTNVGKSSLLNTLRATTKHFNPKYYRDPFDMKAAQMADKQAEQGKEFGYGEESGELTVSFFPGTTLRSKEVENVKVGTRVFDTPGLPTKYRVTDHVSDFKKLKHILMTKEPSLTTIRMDAGGALWIGGLARLDLISGPSVAFIPYVSSEVSLARYTIGKANVNYIKGFGKELFPTYGDSPSATAFEKYTIKTKVNMKHGVHMEEIAIFGLGSITIRQLPHSVVQGEEMHLELYLPKGVGWTLRPPLIGPQEANSAKPMKKVVKKHGADTIEYLSRLQEN